MMFPMSLVKTINRIAAAMEQIARELKVIRLILQREYGRVVMLPEDPYDQEDSENQGS